MKGDSSAFKKSIKKVLYVNHQEHVQVSFSIHVYADACDRKREGTEKEKGKRIRASKKAWANIWMLREEVMNSESSGVF